MGLWLPVETKTPSNLIKSLALQIIWFRLVIQLRLYHHIWRSPPKIWIWTNKWTSFIQLTSITKLNSFLSVKGFGNRLDYCNPLHIRLNQSAAAGINYSSERLIFRLWQTSSTTTRSSFPVQFGQKTLQVEKSSVHPPRPADDAQLHLQTSDPPSQYHENFENKLLLCGPCLNGP